MASKSTGSASKYLKVPISLPSVEDDEEDDDNDNDEDNREDNEGLYVTGVEKKVRYAEEEIEIEVEVEVENIDEKSQGREDDELIGEAEKKENSYGELD